MSQRAPLGGAPGRRVTAADGYDRRDRLPDDFAGRPRPAGQDLTADRGEPADGLNSLRSGALLRWLGTMSTRTAVLVLAAATLVGVVLTLIAHREPGGLLGFFIIVGALVAALGVRRGVVYLFFPMPALAFFAAAVITGIVHDSQLASSTAGLATSFLQWIAGIFVPAVVATIIVLLVGGGRWLLKSALVSGQSTLSAPRPASRDNVRPAPGSRRPAPSAPWIAEDIIGDGLKPGKNGPAPRRGSARPSPNGTRPPRDQRTDRDPWGDPRLSADRSQPPAPRPRPASQPQPRASQPQPRAPRPQSGHSWTPKPQRPPRPQPPDGWT